MSSGGILQLVATGIDTVYLNGDPTITMFKCVYRRHTNFTITQSNCLVKNVTKFDSVGTYTIDKKGDCVSNMILRIDIGKFNVRYLEPINRNVISVLKNFDIIWTNRISPTTKITPLGYKNTLKPFIYNKIEEKVNIYNNYYRLYTDILRGIDLCKNLNNNNKKLVNLKINKIYNDVSFDISKNKIYLQLENLQTNIIPNNFKEKFILLNNEIIERNINNQYDSDISTNLDEMNKIFTDSSNNIIYQNNYNQILYDYGFGMFVLDSSGNYQIDPTLNERVEKIYEIDTSGNYNYDSSGNRITKPSNLTETTQKLSRMFDIIKCYLLDIDTSGNFVSPNYIRNRMYDSYLDKIVTPYIDVSGAVNLKHVYTLYGLLKEIKIPSAIGFLDKNISDYYTFILDQIYGNTEYPNLYYHYTDVSGTIYTKYDSYKLLFKYLNSLSDDNIYDDTTIQTIKPYAISNIYNNLFENYNLFNIISQIIKESYFSSSSHFRFGIFNTYTSYTSKYQADSRLFSIIQPNSLGLIDNFIDNINTVLTNNIYFKTEINNYFNNFIVNLGKSIQSSLFNDYLSDQSLWSFLSFNNINFKKILQTIKYNNQKVYTSLEIGLSQNVLEKMGILNYLPIYLVDDIPKAILTNLANFGFNTLQTNKMDLSSNIYDASGYNLLDTDISFNKTKMYRILCKNVIFNNGNTIADDDFINSYAASYLIDNNKFSLFKISRPEKNYPFVVNNKVYFITNSRAIVEEYRREYYRLIKDELSLVDNTGGIVITNDLKVKIFEKINLVLDNYIRFDFDNSFDSEYIDYSSYISYTTQKYKYTTDISNNKIYNQTISNNDITKYIYAPASIYSSLIKQNTEFYNNFMNDICMSNEYYTNNLGLSMYGLYDKFNYLVPTKFVPGLFTPYEYFSYNAGTSTIKQFDLSNNYYPRIEVDYDLSGLNTSILRTSKYFIYNQTGLNRSIPVLNGYDFYDFQNVISNNDMNDMINGTYNLVDSSTKLQNSFIQYDTSFNNLRYLLDIQNKTINKDISYNVVNTIDYFNSFFVNTSEDVSNNIILPVKSNLSNNYVMGGDLIYNYYGYDPDTNILDISNNKIWSIRDIIKILSLNSNPFTDISGIYPNLYNSYKYNNSTKTTLIYETYYDNIVKEFTKLMYRDPNTINLYNNYKTKENLFEYFKNYLISLSEGNYLLRYNDQTIEIYNSNILKIVTDNKINNYNIISRFLYYNGPIPSTEEIMYKNQNKYPYFPIRNLIPQAILFEESELDVVLNGMISGIAPKYSWVKELGYYIFDYINLELNNDVFERHNPYLLSLVKKMFINNTHKRGLNNLIGNRIELFTYDNTDKSNITIYIPLNFWFTKNTTYNSLPLTNILYSDVNISFKIKKLLDLLIISPNSYVEKDPKIKCTFVTDYVYLEQEERLRIAQSKLEFLVDKYNYGGKFTYKFSDIIKNTIYTKLYMQDPTKFILWRMKIKNTDISNWNKNGYQIKKTKVYNYSNEFTNTDFVTYYPYIVDIPILKKTKINFNGNVRQEGDSNYFNYVVPYECGLGSLDKEEYLYSFSLFPRLLQPSGAANLTMIEELSIDHELTSDIISYMESDNLELEIEYWSLSYQVLRVMSGFIAPAFITHK
jgi:hypothetical protein